MILALESPLNSIVRVCVCFEGGGIYSHSVRSEVKIYHKSYQSCHAQLSTCYVTLTGGGKPLMFLGSRFACMSLCTGLCSLCNIFVYITQQHYTINGCFSVWLIVKTERAELMLSLQLHCESPKTVFRCC